MNIVSKLYYLLNSYTGPKEKRVASYLSSLTEKSNPSVVRKNLISLLQTDAVVVNLWCEYKYRQYRYLNKAKRAILYSNVQIIAESVLTAYETNRPTMSDVKHEIEAHGYKLESSHADLEKLVFLKTIMNYLNPKNNIYLYRESSTFGALLANPNHDKLVGDCNQIVTLYVFLYSLKYNIVDLNLALMPSHVALNYAGIDIEATSGNFINYQHKNRLIAPVEEIVSINLLDTSDSYFKTHKITAAAILESSRIAYLISSNKQLVDKNLSSAYSNIVYEKIKSNSYKSALNYARQSYQQKLIDLVGYNGAIHYIKEKQFNLAIKYASFATQKSMLTRLINENKAYYYYKNGHYYQAIKYYETVGNSEAVKNCYQGLFNKEQKNIGSIRTLDDIKNNQNRIYRLSSYAKKSGNRELVKYTEKLLKYL